MRSLSLISFLVAPLLLTTLSACGKEESNSSPDAIATDLNEQGSSETLFMYWIDGGNVVRGECAGRKPALKSNCRANMMSMSYSEFKEKLDAGLSASIVELSAKIAATEKAMLETQAKIAAARKELEAAKAEKGELSDEEAAALAELEQIDTFVAEYLDQLQFIDEELKKSADKDLVEQRAVVAAELAEFQAQLDALLKKIDDLRVRISELDRTIGDLGLVIDTLTKDLVVMGQVLEHMQDELASLIDDLTVYEVTLKNLEHNIIYRVMSDTDWYKKTRQFVRRFDTIFAKHASAVSTGRGSSKGSSQNQQNTTQVSRR